jgi:hypothetical protein
MILVLLGSNIPLAYLNHEGIITCEKNCDVTLLVSPAFELCVEVRLVEVADVIFYTF